MNKQEWLDKNGFGADSTSYCIVGDDTYYIKETLKAAGFRFLPIINWHAAAPLTIPEGYALMKIQFEDYYEWDEDAEMAYPLPDAAARFRDAQSQLLGPSPSRYMGEVGDRLRNITATYKSGRGFNTKFGFTYLYTFCHKDNILVWFTSKEIPLIKGQLVDLTGTIVAHEEYHGVQTTKLNRCVIKEIK